MNDVLQRKLDKLERQQQDFDHYFNKFNELLIQARRQANNEVNDPKLKLNKEKYQYALGRASALKEVYDTLRKLKINTKMYL